MPKENVKKMIGVLAGVFAETGNLSKEEAMELSGMTPEEFDSVYGKAANIVKKLESYDTPAEKYEQFSKHLYEELSEFVEKFGPFGV
ncbi:hypothetical protein [Maridesulfovibrio bastinii]|jgi:GMP synthase PP-ATPase subunit|uniref:hypothetical protein n=1 Tax=Maridesulfovibrio bastinii TaxID=47157 RepID=UPI00040CE9C6|nr:hypothetical protein [Maridesulfovibrio bastinii]